MSVVVVTDESLQKLKVDLWGEHALAFSLKFPQEEIQPLFSGGCWAGTILWTASIFLVDFLAKEKVRVSGKSVIELGSGIGLPGIASSFLGCFNVLLTEQDPLPGLLTENVNQIFSSCTGFCKPEVCTLDWYKLDQTLIDRSFDVILISDCIFEGLYGDSWKPLAECIYSLSVKGKTKTYNSLQRRNGDGVDDFLLYCESLQISYELIASKTGPVGEELELYEMFLP